MDYQQLNNLTKKDLIDICKQFGIRPCNNSMKKDKIIQNILTYSSSDDELLISMEQLEIVDDTIPGWIDDLSVKQLESIRRDLVYHFRKSNTDYMLWNGNIETNFPVITPQNKEEFKLAFTEYLENN